MLLALFVIGVAMAAQFLSRHRLIIALAGGLTTPTLGGALWSVAPETTDYGFDRSLLGGVHVLAAVAGFAVAAWALTATGQWWSRGAALCGLAAVCGLAFSLEEPARRWHQARSFELLEVPLVAPDISEHGLYDAQAPVVGRPEELAISLEYRRRGAETVGGSFLGIQVTVRRGSAASAAEACTTPYAGSWRDEAGPCRAASRDRWVRYGKNGRIGVFAHRSGALLQLESHGAGEEALLAAAETLRPITAETLAEHVHPVR
ncbi:hypothetical protein ACQEVF_29020 [Nonomuraea polychroma]|uniref:hypothetical protein n=1 Tax=Nonomuraea polychroma TaxID=46176 RepID=UPI003D8B4864